jgi:hypothetical protein
MKDVVQMELPRYWLMEKWLDLVDRDIIMT